jgi:hypothetical protein
MALTETVPFLCFIPITIHIFSTINISNEPEVKIDSTSMLAFFAKNMCLFYSRVGAA